MKFIQKSSLCLRANSPYSLLIVVLVGVLAFAGCERKKKETPFWMLGLLGTGTSTSTSTDGNAVSTDLLGYVKTGQTIVYTAGDNGSHQTGTARSYTDNGNGTVRDNATNLLWQKCSRGQNDDATCTGTATSDTWTNAGTYCTGLSFASRTWRLPTRKELETLPDYGKATSPAMDTTAFPATVVGNYWSSTTYAPSDTDAWIVGFSTGSLSVLNKSSSTYMRCVSGP